jgi:aspartate/methionine/tyrosine aminotransferase
MHISERIRTLTPALIDIIKARTDELRRAGADVINLGQAIPNFPPSPKALAAAGRALAEPDTHVYSPDAGLLPLRRALAEALAREHDLVVDPERELVITAGANQAFLLALLTLLEPGDRVVLPGPYFFNHEMAIRIAGGVPVEAPLDPAAGFRLRVQDLVPYLEGARAVVLCSPNNPTGAVYEPAELGHLARELAARGITLLVDETYRHLVYGQSRYFNPGSLPEAHDTVLTAGSFSKSYSMTGWRVGYLVAPAGFVEEAIKVQDTMVICATVVAQKAALGALQEGPEFVAARRAALDRRRRFLAQHLAAVPGLHWQPTEGAFFAFVRVDGCTDSLQLAMEVLDRAHVVTIPGSLFGPAGEGYLRLSYGSVEERELAEACGRLGRFFGG